MKLDTNITYIGHSTLLIEMDGVRIVTDPLLRQRVGHLSRNKGLTVDANWRRDIDLILISHTHYDHLDLSSLRRIGRRTKLVVPLGAGQFMRRWGFTDVVEMTAGDELQVGSLTVQAIFADHSGFRPPFGPRTECLGFLINGSQIVYFAGDTDVFPEMEDLQEIDVALLPVWGWGPTLGSGHMTPGRAAVALKLIRPRIAIPIHWGTFHPIGMGWFNPSFLFDPPHLFEKHAQLVAPEVEIQIIDPGQQLQLEPISN